MNSGNRACLPSLTQPNHISPCHTMPALPRPNHTRPRLACRTMPDHTAPDPALAEKSLYLNKFPMSPSH